MFYKNTVLMVCSAGGHLAQMLRLSGALEGFRRHLQPGIHRNVAFERHSIGPGETLLVFKETSPCSEPSGRGMAFVGRPEKPCGPENEFRRE